MASSGCVWLALVCVASSLSPVASMQCHQPVTDTGGVCDVLIGRETWLPCLVIKDVSPDKVVKVDWLLDGSIILTQQLMVEPSKVVITNSSYANVSSAVIKPVISPVQFTDARYTLDQASLSLHLSNAKTGDSGAYTCRVETQGIFGYRNDTLRLTVRERPTIAVDVTDVTNVSFVVTWSVPDWFRGHVKEFVITAWNTSEKLKGIPTLKPTDSKFEVTFAVQPYTNHFVNVKAFSDLVPPTLSSNKSFVTKSGIPVYKPAIFRNRTTNTSVLVEWSYSQTEALRGILKRFQLLATPSLPRMQQRCLASTSRSAVAGPNRLSYTLTGLEPYTRYTIHLRVENEVGLGPPAIVKLRTDAGRPDKPKIVNVVCHSRSCRVIWDSPKCPNGRVVQYKLKFCQKERCLKNVAAIQDRVVRLKPAYNRTINGLSPYTSYYFWVVYENKGRLANESDRYQRGTDTASPSEPIEVSASKHTNTSIRLTWHVPQTFYRSIDSYKVKYEVQTVGNAVPLPQKAWCEVAEPMSPKPKEVCTVSGLKNNKYYRFTVQACTNSIADIHTKYWSPWSSWSNSIIIGKDDRQRQNPPNQPSYNVTQLAVSLPIAGVFAIVIVVLMFGIRRYHRFSKQQNRTSLDTTVDYGSQNGETQPMLLLHYREDDLEAVPVQQWSSYVQSLHSDSDLKFSEEYDSINTCYHGVLTLTSQASLDAENKDKNRYVNILAYDHSRTKLEGKNNYINANFVDGYQKPNAYIAAQGPLPNTFEDFWRMIWEQASTTIVMITNLQEKGRLKCNQYWPSQKDESYGSYHVTICRQMAMAHYTVRWFRLRNKSKKKKVPTATLR